MALSFYQLVTSLPQLSPPMPPCSTTTMTTNAKNMIQPIMQQDIVTYHIYSPSIVPFKLLSFVLLSLSHCLIVLCSIVLAMLSLYIYIPRSPACKSSYLLVSSWFSWWTCPHPCRSLTFLANEAWWLAGAQAIPWGQVLLFWPRKHGYYRRDRYDSDRERALWDPKGGETSLLR